MLLHGDELGRTQHGNNNAYGQDNESPGSTGTRSTSSSSSSPRAVAQLRRDHPVFRRRRFFTGTTVRTGDRASGSTTSSGCISTVGRWRPTTGAQPTLGRSGCTSTATAYRAPTAAVDTSRTTTSCCTSTPAMATYRLTLPHEEYAAAWDVVIDTAEDAAQGPMRAGVRSRWPDGACCVLREHVLRRPCPSRRRPRRSCCSAAQDQTAGLRRRDAMHVPTAPTDSRSPSASTCTPPRRRCRYLHDLGVDAPLPSPLLRAAPGSRPRLRRRRPRRRSTRTAVAARRSAAVPPRRSGSGMGLLVDIVPNHMGVADPAREPRRGGTCCGTAATRAYADASTSTGTRRRPHRCRCSATTADAGRSMTREDGELRYHDHRFPMAPGTGRARRPGARPAALRAGALAARRRPS